MTERLAASTVHPNALIGHLLIARFCHEANAAYCVAQGDYSQPSWEDAPDWQKNSAAAGVLLHLNDPTTTPAQSHDSWLKQKAEDGWKYGPVKDPDAKEHPCFVPYDDLPEAQKMKDHIFGAIVRAFMRPEAAALATVAAPKNTLVRPYPEQFTPLLQYFEYAHLPPTLRPISEACHNLAWAMEDQLPGGAEKTVGLRKLLEAKDAFVRAMIPVKQQNRSR